MPTLESVPHKSEQVTIRDLFPKEAVDFTPWLAEPTNLAQLGEVLHLELKLEDKEVDCGGFSLDILAKDTSSGCRVAIENQLEDSDTRHLGQLLTYSAMQDVGILVWVATGFWGKHRTALEWLSRHTSGKIEVYGVEVHGKKVGEMEYSVDFRPVVFPDVWLKRSEIVGNIVSENSRKYRSFFQPLITDLWWDGVTKKGHALYRSEQLIPSGFSDIFYIINFSGNNEAWVYLWIATKDKKYNKSVYDRLHSAGARIEEKLDTELHWIGQSKGRTQASVGIKREGSIDRSDDVLQEIRKWMGDSLLKFKGAAQPHLELAVS